MLDRLLDLLARPIGRLTLLQERALDRLHVRELQAFQRDVQSFEQARPLVIALLAWVGWRTYRAERRRFKRP